MNQASDSTLNRPDVFGPTADADERTDCSFQKSDRTHGYLTAAQKHVQIIFIPALPKPAAMKFERSSAA
ncbi:hypothetical protein CesoFtcFv8_027613 [Champsocephalus esox]|uniref:Uncharacterized protein n=1 Tax=Champsocephalus esox TaxID=159716 RepID=A0AAN7YCB8_9TELE|nr:hypothetical protein CesoFtcFv8_027613 [Champsocephalus esox]